MKEEVRAKNKKKITAEMEETLIERGRQEAHESFRKFAKKQQYGELDLKHLSIAVVFPALLLTMKITMKIMLIIMIKIVLKIQIRL